MTHEQAQDWYVELTNIHPIEVKREDWFKYNPEARYAIDAILDVAKMVERKDGELKSRQVIASIIFSAKIEYKLDEQ